MSATATVRDDDLVACPECRGIVGHFEEHPPYWPDGPTIVIRHECWVCESAGRVTLRLARRYWFSSPPSA